MGVFDNLGIDKVIPDFSIGGIGSGIAKGLTIFAFMLFFAFVIGAFGYLYAQFKKYKYRVTINKDFGSGLEVIGKDRACVVKVGDGGETLLYLRKNKVYRNAYGRTLGKNHYGFAIHDDGYWYNIKRGKLDTTLKEMRVEPSDPAMRMMHSGIRRNVQASFDKKNWFKENIGMLVSILSIVIVLVFMWLLADKWLTINAAAAQSMELSNKVLDRISELLAATDNLCSSGVIG